MRRRTFLGGCTATAAALAGCTGGDQSLDEHPASTALAAQPSLGPTPGTAEGTIVAFEDPSCPSCARFDRDTFPKVKANLVDPGDVSFVFRAIPVVKSWAEPAVLAMESVYDRDEATLWALKTFYFRNQADVDASNVREVTRRFLADETGLDADAVLQDVEQGAHGDAVDTNLRTARDADVGGTPTFFLFESGSFVTDLVGQQDYGVFENSLGL